MRQNETQRQCLRLPSLPRLQNSPYFCVFKYARAVKQKVWDEAENRERDWVVFLSLASFARIRLLRHALPISLLILRNKPTVLESIPYPTKFFYSYPHRVYRRTGGRTLTLSPNFLPSIGFHIPSHVSGYGAPLRALHARGRYAITGRAR